MHSSTVRIKRHNSLLLRTFQRRWIAGTGYLGQSSMPTSQTHGEAPLSQLSPDFSPEPTRPSLLSLVASSMFALICGVCMKIPSVLLVINPKKKKIFSLVPVSLI